MITKAIIPVAGYGTRRLPITKAIEKCMLPICNRPIVDYIVEECVLNGITDIYFVVSPDATQLHEYYGHNKQLEHYLNEHGKQEALDSISAIAREANFHYIAQDLNGPYGTAVPVWLAREAMGDEQFVVLMGDDFLFTPEDAGKNLGAMLKAVSTSEPSACILAMPMDRQRMTKYANIQLHQNAAGLDVFDRIIEKPRPEQITSDLANISRFVLDANVFPHIEKVMQKPNANGEHYLTDAINEYANAGGQMAVVRATGRHLDGGNLPGWIEANNVVFADLGH